MIPFSILDLSPIASGKTAADALHNSLALAQHAERLGYQRYWLAEHHNMPGIASAATAVVIGYIAGGTKTIRVGSGGIMLPNHSPYIIAEQFGTLASLYPDRIDLGLGRAPGTDQATARALRRDIGTADTFPQDVLELQAYLAPSAPAQRIQAVPGAGTQVPLWLLGSSLFGARLAAQFGLPFAFAAHFAPDNLMQALAIYRQNFKPSKQLAKPYTMVVVSVFAADTEVQARYQFTTVQQSFINLRRGTPGQVPAPIDDISRFGTAAERALVDHALAYAVVGSASTINRGLHAIIARTQADELMLTGNFYDEGARLHSFELAADALKSGPL